MCCLWPLARLLSGWTSEPLCKFLEKPVPSVPFPRVNDRAALRRKFMIVNIIGEGLTLYPLLGFYRFPRTLQLRLTQPFLCAGCLWGALWLAGTVFAGRYLYRQWGAQHLGRF